MRFLVRALNTCWRNKLVLIFMLGLNSELSWKEAFFQWIKNEWKSSLFDRLTSTCNKIADKCLHIASIITHIHVLVYFMSSLLSDMRTGTSEKKSTLESTSCSNNFSNSSNWHFFSWIKHFFPATHSLNHFH